MRIGVSGHQQFESAEDVAWLNSAIRAFLTGYPEVATGISCLAIGTDQMFASIIIELGLGLEEVVPCRDYFSTFKSASDRECYQKLSSLSKSHHRLDYPEPTEEAFLRAGQFVVEISDYMLFVWNGKDGGVGGTKDILIYAKSRKVSFTHFNPENHVVCHN